MNIVNEWTHCLEQLKSNSSSVKLLKYHCYQELIVM
jgi:hypothetical protein